MRQHAKRLLTKWPRLKNKIHKTYNVTANNSYNLVFWAVCITLMYGYVLHYNSKGYPNPID